MIAEGGVKGNMNFAEMKQALEKQGALREAAESGEGQALLKKLDTAALERAAKSGDTAAMRAALQSVLATAEGRALAEKVQRAVKKP